MTDKQLANLVRSMWADLRKTEKGYKEGKGGPNWKNAERKRELILSDLERTPVPALGPVLEDGPSMLTYSPTHNTDGVPLHPAFDAGFGQAGRWVLAPEFLTIQRQSGAQGGEAVYALGRSGISYWIGHIGTAPATGRSFKKGERIARIADQSGTDHVHWGVDVRPLTGRPLLYGRTGSGPDYTWGSPTIGQQLVKALQT
jgi:hypothetical protein